MKRLLLAWFAILLVLSLIPGASAQEDALPYHAQTQRPLYECAFSDSELRALVAEAEALKVVDDSEKPYKADIGAGVYGYVSRGLTSASPPER